MSLGAWLKRLLGLDAQFINGRWVSGAELERLKREYQRQLRREHDKQREHDEKMKDPFYIALATLESQCDSDSLLQAVTFVGASGRREALKPLVRLMMNCKYSHQARVSAALMIGKLLAKSQDVAPGTAIFDSWYRSTDELISDVEGATAVGLLAASRDEAAIQALCEAPLYLHNEYLYAELNALSETPDTRCFKKLFEGMMVQNQFGDRICDALEKQVARHGSVISSEMLRLVLATENAKKVVVYEEGPSGHPDIDLRQLKEAIRNELHGRGESV